QKMSQWVRYEVSFWVSRLTQKLTQSCRRSLALPAEGETSGAAPAPGGLVQLQVQPVLVVFQRLAVVHDKLAKLVAGVRVALVQMPRRFRPTDPLGFAEQEVVQPALVRFSGEGVLGGVPPLPAESLGQMGLLN